MDTRHFLLAEHYDSLGLYKVADSLDTIRISQFPGQPEVERDPHKVVVKPKPVAPKQNVSPPTKQKDKTSTPESNQNLLGSVRDIIEKSQPVLQPMNALFTASEIANASRETINNYSLSLLQKIARNGSISARESSQILSIIKNSRNLDSEVLLILKNAAANKIPSVLEVNAIKPAWLGNVKAVVEQSKNFIDKIKAYAQKNPSKAAIAEKASQELGKKLTFWAKAAKAVPTGLVLLNAIMLIPSAMEYFQKISQGSLDEILNDAEQRAKFIVFLSDIVSAVTIYFPPLAPVTSALYAISMGTSAGLYAIDQYREFTGDKKREELTSNFANLPTAKFLIPQSIQEKYLYTVTVDPKNPKKVQFTNLKTNENNFYQNVSLFIKDYIDSLNNIEAAHAIKMIIWPEIKRIIDNKMREGKPLDLKVAAIRNLPALFSGKTVSIRKKNGKYVERKIPPIEFLVNRTTPENAEALFAFNTATQEIVNAINKADILTFEK